MRFMIYWTNSIMLFWNDGIFDVPTIYHSNSITYRHYSEIRIISRWIIKRWLFRVTKLLKICKRKTYPLYKIIHLNLFASLGSFVDLKQWICTLASASQILVSRPPLVPFDALEQIPTSPRLRPRVVVTTSTGRGFDWS
jgi:hypothetical protein